MHEKTLITIIFTLIAMGIIEIFQNWYTSFMYKRETDPKLSLFLSRLTYTILAFLFWRALASIRHEPDYLSSHFFFSLFVYCFFRLIASFYTRKNKGG
jgi:hypothetical protein